MPRFFFHVCDDVAVRDDEGLELRDAAAARLEAVAGIRGLICDEVKKGRLNLRHRVDVEDEAGRPVLSIAFEDAVRIER